MTKIITPNQKYMESYLAALREFYAEGFLTNKINYEEVAQDFAGYLARIAAKKEGKGMPDGYVPQSEYWLIDSAGEYLGTAIVRHRLNEVLYNVGGHIGYYIRPAQRGRGHGTKILFLALREAKNLGLDRVLITCDETNLGSRKIIEANGGVLENIMPNGEGQPCRMRFWIALSR